MLGALSYFCMITLFHRCFLSWGRAFTELVFDIVGFVPAASRNSVQQVTSKSLSALIAEADDSEEEEAAPTYVLAFFELGALQS